MQETLLPLPPLRAEKIEDSTRRRNKSSAFINQAS